MSAAPMLPALAPRALGWLALSLGVVLTAMVIGQFATFPSVLTWYPTLVKPRFNPPNWAFGVVWPALYALMAVAFWRVLRIAPGTPGRRSAIAAFLGQIALNALWSVAFFAGRSPLAGMVVILPLLALILLTTVRFLRLDRPSGLALVPYAAWVAFAALLNASILYLNS